MAQQQCTPQLLHAQGGFYDALAGTNLTIDAAGESFFSIGRLWLEGGSGTKTLSAAGGGAMFFPMGSAITFANGGTTLVCGVQDVASGIEDGTFDVSATLVGGTDPITASRYLRALMESGSKSMTHGDLVALGMEMTARAGADSITVTQYSNLWSNARQMAHPLFTHDTGAGPTKRAGFWTVAIRFDDGTWGYITGLPPILTIGAVADVTYGSTSTPDEYAWVGRFSYRVTIGEIGARIFNVISGDDLEILLYIDPLGTPVVVGKAILPAASDFGAGNGMYSGILADSGGSTVTPYTVPPDTDIAVAVRPTTANTITVPVFDLGANCEGLKVASHFKSAGFYSRTNQTGAFSLVNSQHVAEILAWQTALDDGVNIAPSAHTTQIVSPYRVAGY